MNRTKIMLHMGISCSDVQLGAAKFNWVSIWEFALGLCSVSGLQLV